MAREQGMVFGEDAELYDRARPAYPDALVEDVVSLVGVPCRCVDIGCGTGKAARMLAQRGVVGVGVEAHPDMAGVARRHLAAFRGWRVEIATFEEWAAGDEAPFDLATCAQAWHWLDPAVRMTRVRQALRAGGWLALWWNRPAEDDSALRSDIDQVYDRVAPELSVRSIGSRGGPNQEHFDPDPSFRWVVERAYPWSRTYTATEWTDLLQTQSDHRLLPGGQRAHLLEGIAGVIDRHGGQYEHRYVAWLRAARRN